MYDPILQLNKNSIRGPLQVIMLGLNPSANDPFLMLPCLE